MNDLVGQRAPRLRRAGRLLLAAGLLLVGLNLRIAVAALGPVLGLVRTQLHLGPAAAGLLTTIPVLAFGTFGFLTPLLLRRTGMHRLLGLAMVALAAGILVRWVPGTVGLYAGTVVIGAAIAVSNVLLPATIKHDFPTRVGLLTGLYSTTLFVGAALASGLTQPLVGAVGGSWRAALAVWVVPVIVAALVWAPQTRRGLRAPSLALQGVAEAVSADGAGELSFKALLCDRTAVAVAAHMGLQSTSYYAALTWLPSLLQDGGQSAHEAGWWVSYSALPGVLASLLAPVLARSVHPTWVPVAVAVALTGSGYLGLALVPTHATVIWMTALGLGQGVAISLSLSYIVWRSPDARHTGHLSTMAQGSGYLIAGIGPIGLGLLHSLSHGWAVPLLALGVLLAGQFFAGAAAARDRFVLSS